MMLRLLCNLVSFAVLATPVLAQQTPASQIPRDSAVLWGTLPNGVQYFIRENARPEKRAELRLVVNAGSVLEDEDQRGLAHFVEHMAFNGTRSFEKHEIVNYLESIGMQFGADLNAYTSFDETVYMLTVPTDTGRALEKGVQILHEWAQNIAFDSLEIEKERGVVIEEWRLGLGAEARMRDRIFPTLFRNSQYASRLPIGDQNTLETFEPEALRRFYRDWYRPELMAVVAVGDFDRREVERMIRERFSAIAPAKSARTRPVPPVPDHAETLVAIATDAEAPSTSVEVYWKQPVRDQGTEAAYRRSLVESLYTAMLNARLAELTQQADPPFIYAGSGQGQLIRSKEVYTLAAGVADAGVLRGLEAVLTEAERVRRHGFTATELEREKTNLLRAYEQASAELGKTPSSVYADEYVRAYLDGEPIPGIRYEHELANRWVPGITLEEVNAIAREWLVDSNRVVIVQAPEKADAPVPTREQLLSVFDSVRSKRIDAYIDRVADAALIASTPEPGRIIETRNLAEVGLTEWKLSNGARVLIKPTDFNNDQVLLRAYSPGGHSLVSDAGYTSALLAPTLVSAGGLGSMDAVQLSKALAGKAVQVQPFIGASEEGLSGSTSPRDLETLMQLVHLSFTAPRRDSIAFVSYTSRLAQALANRAASPEAMFQDTLQVTLTQGHIRGQPFSPAALRQVNLDSVFGIYRERFADAGDFTFLFVGSTDTASLRPLVERYIASLPTMNRSEALKDAGIRMPAGVIEKVVRRGTEPKSQTNIVFNGVMQYGREERHLLASMVDALEIRLREVLREDLGGTYGVGVSFSASPREPHEYSVEISFGAAPARLDSLVSVVFEQIGSFQTHGPSAADVAKVKEMQKRSWETSLRQNGYWLAQIAGKDALGEDIRDILRYDELVDRLTPDMIRDAARRYLDRNRYVRVSLVPEVQ